MLETFLIGLAVILVFGLIKSSIRSGNIIENVVIALIASPPILCGMEYIYTRRRLSTICVMRLLQIFLPVQALCKLFCTVRPVRSSLVLHLQKPWMGRAGGRGALVAKAWARLWELELIFWTTVVTPYTFLQGDFSKYFFNMWCFHEMKRPPWDFSSFGLSF